MIDNGENQRALTGYEVLDGFGDPVVMFDPITLKVTHLNKPAKEMALVHAGSGLDFKLASTWLAMSKQEIRDKIKTTVSGKVLRLETELFQSHYQISVFQWSTPNGNRRLLCSFQDISDRIDSERIQKELVSTITHELRSPLSSIKGAMGLILSGVSGGLPARSERLLKMAYRNADRLMIIVSDLLDLDKMADGSLTFVCQDTDLAKIATDALDSIAGFSDRFDVSVTLDPDHETLVSHIDPNRMAQVLINLLSNAIKFSPPEGQVIIKINRLGSLNRLSVIDFGQGIPLDQQGQLFKRFSQVSNSPPGGSGLGLCIAKSIVENQGGSVSFESTEGKGTTFHVDLPRVPNNAIKYPNIA